MGIFDFLKSKQKVSIEMNMEPLSIAVLPLNSWVDFREWRPKQRPG